MGRHHWWILQMLHNFPLQKHLQAYQWT
jgi:hypothetical protein